MSGPFSFLRRWGQPVFRVSRGLASLDSRHVGTVKRSPAAVASAEGNGAISGSSSLDRGIWRGIFTFSITNNERRNFHGTRRSNVRILHSNRFLDGGRLLQGNRPAGQGARRQQAADRYRRRPFQDGSGRQDQDPA